MMNSGPGSYGPGPLEPLWMAMGDIGRGCYEHRDQMSACGFLEDSAGEIGYWLESDGYIPDAPEKTTKNVKLAEELLGNVDSVLLVAETLDPEAAKMECRRAKKDLCKFEKDNFGEHDDDSMFCNEDDFLARQLGYDDDWRNQQFSLYGETDDFEAQLEAMIAEKLAQFQESLDVIMETQIAKFMDVADRMIENAVLAAVNDALATAVQTFETALGDRVSASLNKAIGDKMSERVQYYPEEHIQKVEQNHEEILTAVNPILAALPPETLADVPEADDVLETALTELVSTEATTNIKAEVRKFENVVNSLTETDADGDIVPLEGKEEELKEETGEFFTAFEGILEDPEELEHLKEDGLVPDLGDIEEIEGTWYEEPAYAATAVLEDRPALVTGTGDGNLAPSAPFMLVEVGTILNRMTNDGEEDAGAFPGTVGIPEWAEGHMGSLVGNGTIPEDEVDDFDYYATATRDDIAYLTIRNMEATHPDFDDVDFGPCVLDNVTPDVSCDHPHADEIDAAYKIGLMTGQGDGSWDPEGEFNRAQGFKVTTLADQFLTELDNVGPDVISDVVNQQLDSF